MCLYNADKIKNHGELTCYKVVFQKGLFKKKYFSVFEKFRYEIGKAYEVQTKGKSYYVKHRDIINGGFFHTFKNYDDAVDFLKLFSPFNKRFTFKIIECVIPSDCYVYEGEYEYRIADSEIRMPRSYASTKIFPKKIWKFEK